VTKGIYLLIRSLHAQEAWRTLSFTPEFEAVGPLGPGGGPPPPNPEGPSLFTALQEQLGLKLVSQRAPVDVLVVDRLERPSAN
jgi:uncharacterized protein (TIGR03435 family)